MYIISLHFYNFMSWPSFSPFVRKETGSESLGNLPKVTQQVVESRFGLRSVCFQSSRFLYPPKLSHLRKLFCLLLNYGYYVSYLLN